MEVIIEAEQLPSMDFSCHWSFKFGSSTEIIFLFVLNCRLGRLQDSNAVMSHFNEYSENCFAEVAGDFSRNTRLLKSMKLDLDYIFQKLRYCLSVLLILFLLVKLHSPYVVHICNLFCRFVFKAKCC